MVGFHKGTKQEPNITEELKVVCPSAKSIILSEAAEMLVDT
jgi:hypothetical protein